MHFSNYDLGPTGFHSIPLATGTGLWGAGGGMMGGGVGSGGGSSEASLLFERRKVGFRLTPLILVSFLVTFFALVLLSNECFLSLSTVLLKRWPPLMYSLASPTSSGISLNFRAPILPLSLSIISLGIFAA